MEFIRPMPSWAEFHQAEPARDTFRKFRTPGIGEEMILQGNAFVEHILPASIVRPLSEDEMNVYRAPFPTPESRIPTWRLPNELPIEGSPADVWARLSAAHAALRASTYPKLLFAGDPGALVSPDYARAFAAELEDCRLVLLGAGRHYLQEDHPDTIAREVVREIERLPASRQSAMAA
jgi:haloalkane dehalogenase